MLYPVELRALYLAKMTPTEAFFCLFYGDFYGRRHEQCKTVQKGGVQFSGHSGAEVPRVLILSTQLRAHIYRVQNL